MFGVEERAIRVNINVVDVVVHRVRAVSIVVNVRFIVFVWYGMEKIVIRIFRASGVAFSIRVVVCADAGMSPGVVIVDGFKLLFGDRAEVLSSVGD